LLLISAIGGGKLAQPFLQLTKFDGLADELQGPEFLRNSTPLVITVGGDHSSAPAVMSVKVV
jgi:hypothetical protein